MKKKIVLFLLVFFISLNVFAADYEYNAADFDDISKMTKKLTDNNFEKLKKWNVSKLLIVEFAGEFMQSKEVSSSVFAQRATNTLTTKTSTIYLGNDYYNSVINRVYELVEKAFEDAGFEVVPKENLTELEYYKSLELDFEKTTKGYKGSVFSDGVTTKGIKMSAEGLGLFPTNPLKAIKLISNLAELTNAAQANGAIKVSFYIDKGKKGAPVLKSFDIILNGDLRGDEVGFKGNKKISYGFYKQNQNIFKLKKSMENRIDISGEEKGSVDLEKYDNGLMELINATINMMKESLKGI